jgi:hypothetical protein
MDYKKAQNRWSVFLHGGRTIPKYQKPRALKYRVFYKHFIKYYNNIIRSIGCMKYAYGHYK